MTEAFNPLDGIPRFEFWQHGVAILTRNLCEVLRLAGEPVNCQTLAAVVKDLPTTRLHFKFDCQERTEWMDRSFFSHCMKKAHSRVTPENHPRFKEVAHYFFEYFVSRSNESKEMMIHSLLGMLPEIEAGMKADRV